MSNEVINTFQQFLDAAGQPVSGGTVSFFNNTTAVLSVIYSDEALSVEQANPYTLDSAGRIRGDVRYEGKRTLQLKDRNGATIRTTDNVTAGVISAATETVATYAALRALESAPLVDGNLIHVSGFPDAWEVKTGTVTDDGWFLVFDDDANRYAESTSFTVDVAIFGTANDGVTDDTLNLQAAISAVINGSDSFPKKILFGAKHLISDSLMFGDTGGPRYEVLGGFGIASTEIITDYNGYGAGAKVGAAFQFGDLGAPAFQTAVVVNGFLFNNGPNSARQPIGIAGDSLAQSRINNITFGGWNNTALSLNTPQNCRGDNFTTFGGGLSFEYRDASSITVTQTGTTLTSSGAIFTASDAGKTVGIWGVGTDYRRKAKIVTFNNATSVEVDTTLTDATARRLLYGSPFASVTASSTTLVADAPCFTADHVGLVLWIKGAGNNSGLLRAKIDSFTSTTIVELDTAALTTTAIAEFGVGAVEIYSDDAAFSNGASDNRFDGVQIEDHNGIGLCVFDSDILEIKGKIHGEQTATADDYSISTIWSDRWGGLAEVSWDAQYLGEDRGFFTNQTSTLNITSLSTRTARNETIVRIGDRSPTFEGALVKIGAMVITGDVSTDDLRGTLIRDSNTPIAGYSLNDLVSRPAFDLTQSFLGRNVFANDDGDLVSNSISFDGGGNDLDAYTRATPFTPEVADAETGGNPATGTFTGNYERVGNITFVSIRLLNINTAGMTGGNNLYIRGLAEALRGGTANLVTAIPRLDNVTFAGYPTVFADDGDNTLFIYSNTSGAASTVLTVAALATGTADIRISLVYLTSDV